MRIMVVEDEHLVARDIERILCQAGYVVTSIASSAGDAVKRATEDRPDLILMDIMLQRDMSGIEAAREIRKRLEIPVIFITAYADEETIEAAKTAEPFGYVLKPLNEKELRASVELAWHKFARDKMVKERAENRYQLLIENITEGIALLDPNNVITYVNDRFLSQKGYTRSEVIGHTAEEFIEDSVSPGEKKTAGKNAKGRICELRLKTKGSNPFCAVILSEPLFNEEGKPAGRIAIITDISERLHFEEQLNRSREELRSLSQHLQSVREEESKRIAREIHDELGQALTALKMDISWLSRRHAADVKDQDQFLGKISSMSELIDGTIQLVQKITAELRPGLLDDLGLVPAIEWQLQDFQNRTKIRCRARVECPDLHLTPDQSTAIFRVFQEALTNVVRHAEATQVDLLLQEKNSNLILTISDNGRGIEEFQVYAPGSLGFMGMRERLRPFHGELEVHGTPRKGTTVRITLPLTKTQADD